MQLGGAAVRRDDLGAAGDALIAWIGYVLLAIPTVLLAHHPERAAGVARSSSSGSPRLAAAWMYVMFTRSPRPWQAHPVRMAIYMVGLLAIASVLMWLQPALPDLRDHGLLPRDAAPAVAAR